MTFRRLAGAFALAFACSLAAAQSPPLTKGSLEHSEPLFSTMAALNACGYDQELASSHPLRARVRAQVARSVERSGGARAALDQVCRFYRDKQLPDAGQNVAQFISLALRTGPDFELMVKESELPPDASNVLGFLPLLRKFYTEAGLQKTWQAHQAEYDKLIDIYSPAVAQMVYRTDIYLKLPQTGYVVRRFIVLLEPLVAPGKVNARNYGDDYMVVVSPSAARAIKMEQVRHTYLHYVLDPLVLKRANSLRRLDPLLNVLASAPMDDSYKREATLFVTESLIRAIEARQAVAGRDKAAEQARRAEAERAVSEGFTVARYFVDALAEFEKSPTGLPDAIGDLLWNIDVNREKDRAEQVVFARQSSPEVVATRRPAAGPLESAEAMLASGDAAGARKMAQQALDERSGDAGQALFTLARAAVLSGELNQARTYFERTLEVAKNPRTLGWAHVFLARVFDMQARFEDGTVDEEIRAAAVKHYKAALEAGEPTPELRNAVERGLQQPYAPPVARK